MFFHWILILSSAQSIKESGICGHLLRSPIRKNRPLRLFLLRISAGISPLFFRPRFFDNSPLPARYQNKYDNSPAKLDSLQVLVEGHRFFRFPFRFTAGRDAPLFSVLAFFGGDAPLSYNMQKNFVSEQKKVHLISSVDNVDNYVLFYCFFSMLKHINKRTSSRAARCKTCFVNLQKHKIF